MTESHGTVIRFHFKRVRSDCVTSRIVVATGSNITARPMTMRKGQPASALRQLRALFAAGTATGLSDSELLERYTTKRAESADAATAAEMAFAALVDRHGAMVWGVCHRVLGDAHEAEDAFQATFLVSSARPERCGWTGRSADGSTGSLTACASGPVRGPATRIQQ